MIGSASDRIGPKVFQGVLPVSQLTIFEGTSVTEVDVGGRHVISRLSSASKLSPISRKCLLLSQRMHLYDSSSTARRKLCGKPSSRKPSKWKRKLAP